MTFLKSLADASWNWLGRRAERDEVDEEVDQVVSAIIVRRSWILCAGLVILSVPFLIHRVVELHVAGLWGSADHDALRTLMFGRAIIGVIAGDIIFTLVYVRGSCGNVELNVLTVFVHVLCFLNTWTPDNTLDLMRFVALGGSLRVAFAFVVCKIHLVFALNVMSLCWVCARSHWTHLSDVEVDFIMLELSFCVITMMMSAFSDSLMRREAKVMLHATLAARSERTAQELLSLVCGAVLTLDGQFCLRTPSPALGALLFHSSVQAFCGVDFAEVVSEDDRERLRDFLVDSVRPGCVHVHLRDSSGARVAVQLFHTRLEGLLWQLSHVFGIREETEGQLGRHPPDSHNGAATVCQQQVPTGGADIVSFSSGASDCLECSCIVDAASFELTLLVCSPCFTAISGAQSRGLFQWIVGDRSGFRRWLQTSAHCVEQGEDTLPMLVIFAPPQCGNLEHAVCDAAEVLEDSWDDDAVPVKKVLSQVLRKRRGISRRNGTRPVYVRNLSL